MDALTRVKSRVSPGAPLLALRQDPARSVPTLVRAGDHGFDPAEAHILAGQSIVLLAEAPARFLVELVEPAAAPHEA